MLLDAMLVFFFTSGRRHTRYFGDWSSDVCSSDLRPGETPEDAAVMTRFFISRPIFASVISIIVVIAGLMASQTLPVAQYPEITPPTVIITATFPGANAETLSRTVAAPIEEQLSGIEGLLYYNSQSTSNGTETITATFEV